MSHQYRIANEHSFNPAHNFVQLWAADMQRMRNSAAAVQSVGDEIDLADELRELRDELRKSIREYRKARRRYEASARRAEYRAERFAAKWGDLDYRDRNFYRRLASEKRSIEDALVAHRNEISAALRVMSA